MTHIRTDIRMYEKAETKLVVNPACEGEKIAAPKCNKR